jgi:glycosyltransferase involved in cell wall biosynthesis
MTAPPTPSSGPSDPAPQASVVVAAFGRTRKTIACIESLLAQRGVVAEIIVVDDGSPDGTADAVAELLAHEAARATGHRTLLLRNERNLGANPSRNRGVEAATAPIVAFIDSDCTADPDWLANLLRPFADPTVGAVSGLVEDACDDNIWELLFRGTHRLPRRGPVSRIVIGNLAVRRALLAAQPLDESRPVRRRGADGLPDITISARSDEEGLNLAIRAAGWKVLAEPSARARHFHPYTRASLFRQAFFGGCSAAEIVWKYRLGPRKDLGPILLFDILLLAALAALPFLGAQALLAPAIALAPPVAAISYNELRNKGKTPLELLRIAPALVVYYHIRLGGYLLRRTQLLLGHRPIARVDPRELARGLPSPERAP